jgi:hypothetical protein
MMSTEPVSIAAARASVTGRIDPEVLRRQGFFDGWRACVAAIRRCDPKCTDDCKLCDFRGDILLDLEEELHLLENGELG